MEYLRWRDDGTPAAGMFEEWPNILKEFTALDPCCGSGHFLVSAFNLLVPLRMQEEGLSARDACDNVLQENLFGLELDPRCTQIAAFALALAAWKHPGEDGRPLGYRQLPPLNIACSGQGVVGKREEWQLLANGNHNLKLTLGNLYDLFLKAPDLGSLIDPRAVLGAPGITGSLAEVQPLLAKALARQPGDADLAALGVAAQGIAKAAELLSGRYTLVTTNVPYLGRGKQDEVVKEHLANHYTIAKADLATAFVLRCLELCSPGSSAALVTPQNWLFLKTYKKLREALLKEETWNLVARLGSGAFETISGEVVNVTLLTISNTRPAKTTTMSGLDVAAAKTPAEKADRLANRLPTSVQVMRQEDQLRNPDAIVTTEKVSSDSLLSKYASSVEGLSTGDGDRYAFCHWEVCDTSIWQRFHASPDGICHYGGQYRVIRWENGKGSLAASEGARVQGHAAWNKRGVLVGQMNTIPCCLYGGNIHDKITAAVIPHNPDHLLALWSYLSSPDYRGNLRKVNQKMIVVTGTLVQVPFDLCYWQAVAAEKYPNGLPRPHSDDPTQWLFKGDIASSTDPLQVAVARLLGFRWPEQPQKNDAIDKLTDKDGIVCIPAVRTKAPAAERLLEVLRTAYGSAWTAALLDKLLTDTGCKAGTALDDWLRNQFFEQHCKRFHHRPFIWHIWDGRKDGFSCLVNYPKLNHKTLENLTYSYLGDWLKTQNSDTKAGRIGADLRLAAAQALQEKLKLILAGEPPYDIFVRWKPLSEQAIGWNPDVNDGVRMNIRPFVQADILRKPPNIKWTKDRGKEPERDRAEYPWFWKGTEFVGDRVNDVHLSNAEKLAAREGAK
jgi:hypothetical protein